MGNFFCKALIFTLALLSFSTALLGQRRVYHVVVDDIAGVDGQKIPEYEIEGESFELTITSFKSYFNMARVDVIDRSLNALILSRYFFKPYDGDTVTDFYIGDLEYNKVYEMRVTFMIYNEPQLTKRIRITRVP